MLLDILKGGITPQNLIFLALYVVIILFSLSFHEVSHGYVAYRCGDSTARNLGRLTLNPLAHLDPIGTIMMLLFGFGYAKPVPINPRNFNHYKRDLAFVSLAGPASNLLLAFVGTLIFYLSLMLMPDGTFALIWCMFWQYFTLANAGLCVFNLLPIPPLDGSRIVSVLLPGRISYYYLKYERYIMIVMFLLLYRGVFSDLLSFLRNGLMTGVTAVVEFILTPLANILAH